MSVINKNSKIFLLFIKFLSHISFKKKVTILFVFFITIISAFSEIVSITAIVPFIDLIIQPNKMQFYLDKITYFKLDNYSHKELLIIFTLFFILIISLSAFLRGVLIFLSTKISNSITYDLNILIYSYFYNQSFLSQKKNSLSLVLSILTKVHDVGVFYSSLISGFSSFVVTFFIIVSLFHLEINITLWGVVFIIIIYFFIIKFFKKKLLNNSKIISVYNEQKVSFINNSIGFSRYIILHNVKNYFIDNFKKINKQITASNISNTLIASFPGLLIVTLSIVTLSLVVLQQSLQGKDFYNKIPVLVGLVFGIQRILPNLNQIYSSITKTRANYYGAKSVLDFITNLKKYFINEQYDGLQKINFKKSIIIKNLTFGYGRKILINNLNFKIKKGVNVSIAGKSGAGKSTLLDIIMGFIPVAKGEIYIDNKILSKKNIYSWRKLISHVPQNIFIGEFSLKNNIALGEEENHIDMIRVKECCRIAQIKYDIESLEKGYNSVFGKDIIDMSGGQKQRIGIARALYFKPKILVLDEATNALDKYTEKKIFDNLKDLKSEITIISISHKIKPNSLFKEQFIFKNKKLYKA